MFNNCYTISKHIIIYTPFKYALSFYTFKKKTLNNVFSTIPAGYGIIEGMLL
jgi:hypothetical protein